MSSVILWVFFVLTVAFSAVLGLIRGLNKSLIRLVTLIPAAVLTFLTAGPLTNLILKLIKINGATIGELLLSGVSGVEGAADFLEKVPMLQEAIAAVPAFALALVLFPLMFLFYRLVTWIVYLCVQKPVRKGIFRERFPGEGEEQQSAGMGAGKRFAGMAVGLVAGALMFGMLSAPMMSILTMLPSAESVSGAVSYLAEEDILLYEDAAFVDSMYGTGDCALVMLYDAVGLVPAGHAYLKGVTRIEADGQVAYLADEFEILMNVLETALDADALEILLNSEDQNRLVTLLSDHAFMDSLLGNMFRSRILCSFAPELMSSVAESVALGMRVPQSAEDVYNNLLNAIALAVQDADVDYAGIDSYERNPLSSRLTQSEYEKEIQKQAELTDTISQLLNRAIAGCDREFADSVAIQIVAAVRTQVLNGGGSAEEFYAGRVQDAIVKIDPSTVKSAQGNSQQLLLTITASGNFKTDSATVGSISNSVRRSLKNAVMDESRADKAAKTLATVISGVAGAVSSATDETGRLNISSMNFTLLADAVSELQKSELKEIGGSVLDIVASSELGSSSAVSGAIDTVREGYNNGEDLGGAIGTVGTIINLGSSLGGSAAGDRDTVTQSVADLIEHLNEYTIDLMLVTISSGAFVPEEYTEATCKLVETLLRELLKLKDSLSYDNEVDSILVLLNLLTSGADRISRENVIDLMECAERSDAIFNTLMSVATSNPLGIRFPDDTVSREFASAVEEYYSRSEQTQKNREICSAVASLFGIDEQVNIG